MEDFIFEILITATYFIFLFKVDLHDEVPLSVCSEGLNLRKITKNSDESMCEDLMF